MNLILLFEEDFAEGKLPDPSREYRGRVELVGRRRQHVHEIVRAAEGDKLAIGALGGRVGRGRVLRADREVLALEIELDREPPAKLDSTLILAVPRPPVLRRVVSAVTSLGVERIVLLHSRRVEKTYWNAGVMQPESLHEAMCLGLEQARDTRLPTLEFERRFRPFAEDRLPQLADRAASAIVATPGVPRACPARLDTPSVIAVGPEGGWLDFEIERLEDAGLSPVHLGERALRVETAVPVLLSRLLPASG